MCVRAIYLCACLCMCAYVCLYICVCVAIRVRVRVCVSRRRASDPGHSERRHGHSTMAVLSFLSCFCFPISLASALRAGPSMHTCACGDCLFIYFTVRRHALFGRSVRTRGSECVFTVAEPQRRTVSQCKVAEHVEISTFFPQTHTYIQASTHTQIQASKHTHTHTRKHLHIHTHRYTSKHTHTHLFD